MRPLALALLAALVSADPGTGVLQAIFDSGLPGRLLQDLLETPGRAFLQVHGRLRPFLFVIAAKC